MGSINTRGDIPVHTIRRVIRRSPGLTVSPHLVKEILLPHIAVGRKYLCDIVVGYACDTAIYDMLSESGYDTWLDAMRYPFLTIECLGEISRPVLVFPQAEYKHGRSKIYIRADKKLYPNSIERLRNLSEKAKDCCHHPLQIYTTGSGYLRFMGFIDGDTKRDDNWIPGAFSITITRRGQCIITIGSQSYRLIWWIKKGI